MGRCPLGVIAPGFPRTSTLRGALGRLLLFSCLVGMSGLALGALPVQGEAGDSANQPLRVLAADPARAFVAQDDASLVVSTYTGVMTSTYQITGVREQDVAEYSTVNFSQVAISSSEGMVTVQIVARSDLATNVAYPLDQNALPSDALAQLEPQPGWIQSDHPDIVTQAAELVQGVSRQDVAVARVVTWVRAHTRLDADHTANDAQRVFQSIQEGMAEGEAGVADRAGFATLSCALLRAAGIPARYIHGAVLPSDVTDPFWNSDHGVWQAWIEVYYPDLGWVASDPQFSINWIDSAHLRHGMPNLGTEHVTITRISHEEHLTFVYDQRTPYTVAHDQDQLRAAYTPGGGAFPLRTDLGGVYRVTRDSPARQISGTVANERTCGMAWELEADAPWLSFAPAAGEGEASVTMELDATELLIGTHVASVQLSASSFDPDGDPHALPLTHTVTVELLVSEAPRAHLPLLSR